jgi:putative spermidine/putrescine transport system permease protein
VTGEVGVAATPTKDGSWPPGGRRGGSSSVFAVTLRGWWRAARESGLVLVAPAAIALVVIFFLPLVRVIAQSVNDHLTTAGGTDHYLGAGNYTTLFTDGYTVRILIRTLIIGAVISVVTAVFAYPYAYMMTIVTARTRAVLVTIVLVPLWTSALARTFAWVVLLQGNGPVDDAFHLVLMGSPVAVTIAMGQVLLPFAVLPMYTVMQGIDRDLLSAGESLGASRFESFRRIYFPLSLPGLTTGMSLVFVLTLGFYLTPALLGTAQDAVIAQLIIIKTNLLDFGGAGALGVFVLVVTLVILWLGNRLARSSTSRISTGARVGATAAAGAGTTNAVAETGGAEQ